MFLTSFQRANRTLFPLESYLSFCIVTAVKSRLRSMRYGVAAILACAFYFLLPFSLEVRQTLVILAFSPIGSAVPPFTGELGGDVGLSSAINSVAIVISICIYVVLLGVML